MTQTLDHEAWRTLLDRTDGTPTYDALVDTVARADTIDGDAEEHADAALADGRVVGDADAGMFGDIRVAGESPEPSDSDDVEGRGAGSSDDGPRVRPMRAPRTTRYTIRATQ